LEILEGICAATQSQTEIRKMLNALKFFYKRVNLDELFERTARASEPGVKALVVRKVSEDRMIMSLQELVDDARVKCAS